MLYVFYRPSFVIVVCYFVRCWMEFDVDFSLFSLTYFSPFTFFSRPFLFHSGLVVSLPPTLALLTQPILAPLYSAGFSFSKCHAVQKVPADPNLQMIFGQDEFTTFARYCYCYIHMQLCCEM
jgi:hypothetical protein